MSVLAFLTVTAVLLAYLRHLARPKNTVPVIGFSGWATSWITAISWVFGGAPRLVYEGYIQSPIFQVANLDTWIVLVNRHLTHELRGLPDEVASFMHAADEFMQSEYTHKRDMVANPWHVPVVRNKLTKHLPELCAAVCEETTHALDAEISVGDSWTTLPALATVQRIVARGSSRILVGQNLARDASYLSVALNFALDVVVRARIINFFPRVLKPLAGWICLLVPSLIEKGINLLEPDIDGRKRDLLSIEAEFEDVPVDKLDMMTWLIQAAPADDCSSRTIAIMLMNLNLATIYSTSMVLTHVLYNIATEPQYIAPLRAEIEESIEAHGWTKEAFGSMTRLDSFLKETLRLNGTAAYSGMRKILRPTVLSDGTRLETGTIVAVATLPTHCDASVYPNPNQFVGFRFDDLRERHPDRAAQQSSVTANDEFLVFGLGRHVWYVVIAFSESSQQLITLDSPGRFFATMQLKVAIAQMLLRYDIALDGGVERPTDKWVGESCIPNPTASLRLRRRKTEGA